MRDEKVHQVMWGVKNRKVYRIYLCGSNLSITHTHTHTLLSHTLQITAWIMAPSNNGVHLSAANQSQVSGVPVTMQGEEDHPEIISWTSCWGLQLNHMGARGWCPADSLANRSQGSTLGVLDATSSYLTHPRTYLSLTGLEHLMWCVVEATFDREVQNKTAYLSVIHRLAMNSSSKLLKI